MTGHRSLLLTAALVIIGLSARAQVPAKEPAPADLQRCLLNTKPETWTALKLSHDQLRRMSYVQEACSEECDAAGMKKAEDAISSSDGSTVMAEVSNILTEEQYRTWVGLCAAGALGTPPK